MRVLFLVQGETIPSSRFRVSQFIDRFRAAGVDAVVRSAYDARYNEVARRGGVQSAAYKLLARAKRFALMADASSFDLVFVQRPTFPFTSLPERALRHTRARVVFDVDDAIFAGVGGTTNPLRMRVFQECAAASDVVVVGNTYLRATLPDALDVRVIPTVIDTEKYMPRAAPGPEAARPLVIGWMGTAGNFPFLESTADELRAVLSSHPNVRLRLVSNAEFLPLSGHEQVEQIRWTAATEVTLLQSFDVGLMPLHDTLHARGKCAFKMIQYMAVGVPYVASPVGANVDVHETSPELGLGGLLAGPGDWTGALTTLLGDGALRNEMGTSGRARAVESYSLDAVLPRYLSIFEELQKGSRRSR